MDTAHVLAIFAAVVVVVLMIPDEGTKNLLWHCMSSFLYPISASMCSARIPTHVQLDGILASILSKLLENCPLVLFPWRFCFSSVFHVFLSLM